ncbi:CU044_2847 family protein, partial [Streptomyces sp. NPDC003860]
MGAARTLGQHRPVRVLRRPDQASVTFGVELTAKSGAALAVLASGETKAS